MSASIEIKATLTVNNDVEQIKGSSLPENVEKFHSVAEQTLEKSEDIKLCEKRLENNTKVPSNVAENHEMLDVAVELRESSSHQYNGITSTDDISVAGQSQLSPGLSLLQQAAAASSPPPHSYRHSRAYRHFRNPPQPHMCIRTTTEAGEELFINVLSWTRIVIPQEPSDPIPLYGGMRVPPNNPRSPPIVFAVMANPEVLKDSGRHSKDPEERRAMVELMCDFVEAMNPGVKLVRNAVILKDRDISGELKDVWNAVQCQRDREREEQIMQQRQQQQQQQQHYHNLTNSTTNGATIQSTSSTTQQMFPKSMLSSATTGHCISVDGTPPRTRKVIQEGVVNETDTFENNISSNTSISLALLAEHLDNKITHAEEQQNSIEHFSNNQNNAFVTNGNNETIKNKLDTQDAIDKNNKINANNDNKQHPTTLATSTTTSAAAAAAAPVLQQTVVAAVAGGNAANCNGTSINLANNTSTVVTAKAIPVTSSQSPAITTSALPVVVNHPPAATKKEKLGGFLPNGCIFPRFSKNSKHKDKDKESKTKDKEKNVLLNALKKSKDKKSNATSLLVDEKQQQQQQHNDIANATNIATNAGTAHTTTSSSSSSIQVANKHCLEHLEIEVQKLDLNHIEQHTASASKTNSGVGVH